MKSFVASPATIERKWYVVDAEGCTLRPSGFRRSKRFKRKEQTISLHHTLTQVIM